MPAKSLDFGRAADFYDKTRGFPPGEESHIAALLARVGNLTPTSQIIEIGIGTGRIALPLSEHSAAIYGIDLARSMMERLREKQSDEPIYLAEGDAMRLPFPASAFDAAVAVHVFHLIAEWPIALRELARVLRPGGMLIHAYNDRGEAHPTEKLMWAAWNDTVGKEQPPSVGVSHDRFKTFLEDEGWRPGGEAQTHHLEPEIHSPAGFLYHLEARSWSSQWRVSDEALARGVAAVRAALAQNQIDPEQTYSVERPFVARAYFAPTTA